MRCSRGYVLRILDNQDPGREAGEQRIELTCSWENKLEVDEGKVEDEAGHNEDEGVEELQTRVVDDWCKDQED